MERPDFDSIKDLSEFKQYYWYRNELAAICKAYSFPCGGSKPEPEKAIEAYFAKKAK